MSRVIEAKADELVKKYRQTPAIAVDQIAISEGAGIKYDELDDQVSGLLVRKDTEAFIVVNAGHAETRQRFTIAHELGHLLLHRATPGIFVDGAHVQFREDASTKKFDPREVQANIFAASLLIPEQFLRKELQAPIDIADDDAIRDIALRYNVSAQALTIRLMNLGLVAGYSGIGSRASANGRLRSRTT